MLLGGTLKDHWGAVGRDLIVAGYTWDDVGSERLPIPEFVSFVAYAPPGTAMFYQRNQGWTTNDHLQAQAIDALNYLAWAKTTDAQRKNPQHRPEPIPRPGMKRAESKPSERLMTIAEYAAKVGIKINWEE